MASIFNFIREVRIPTLAGYVAGKWWGPPNRRPIVALHGWQDNCGSFDKLIPLLPKHIPVLALDSPGHGRSFRIPHGTPYHQNEVQVMLKQIKKYFGWDKISLMGHSLGAISAYTYGFLFPKDVDFIVCMDGLQPLIHKFEEIALNIENFINYDTLQQTRTEPPSFTIEEMIKKMHYRTNRSVKLDVAMHILQRNIAPCKRHLGQFYFTRDTRIKARPLESVDPLELLRVAENIRFPIFLSKTADISSKTIFFELFPILKRASKDFQYHSIPGTHYAHLNKPELIAGLISEFIMKHDTEDRKIGGITPEIVFDDDVEYASS